MKHIFIIGGVVSSLGKGIIGASLGALFKSKGYSIFIQKLDPYLNIDSGTMNPNQHGEVFVTDDGTETDLDLGHYERFTGESLSNNSSITQGKIYLELLSRERAGKYLGETVQVIPHVTNLIKEKILQVEREGVDIVITEVGGTVGDIESLPFIESIRSLKSEFKDNIVVIYVTLVPYLHTSGEFKTKPTQHSVSTLRSFGISPDFLVLRSENTIPDASKEKISLFCGIDSKSMFNLSDVKNIYEIPLLMTKQHMSERIEDKLNLCFREMTDIYLWEELNKSIAKIDCISADKSITIGIIGKYSGSTDSYISVEEAIKHASYHLNLKVNIKYLSTDDFDKEDYKKSLLDLDGILIPGGFGKRGTSEKIKAIEFARVNNVPFFGICLGMQLASIEFARNVLNIKDADSEEFNDACKNKIIRIIKEDNDKGGTQRLGSYLCNLSEQGKCFKIYKTNNINERHRHRYEFNNKFRKVFEDNGMIISGICSKENLVEIIELKDHDHFIAVQFHPEFKSRLFKPHPLFTSFLEAAFLFKLKKQNG